MGGKRKDRIVEQGCCAVLGGVFKDSITVTQISQITQN